MIVVDVWYFVLVGALILDLWLGEPKRFHPLVGFGFFAQLVERKWNLFSNNSVLKTRAVGIAALFVVVGFPLVALLLLKVTLPFSIHWCVDLLILYLAVGRKSLVEHALAIFKPLQQNNMAEARKRVGYIVSRDTAAMDERQVTKATIESILENGSDSVFAALFWFLVAGALGVLAYRLINTLDAMWGYRTERYRYFGWAAARIDDVLNWIPARLTAISYAILAIKIGKGSFLQAIKCWREQAQLCESPNGGVVMTTGAGALGVCLGGAAVYHGVVKEKPIMGLGYDPEINDIHAAVKLVNYSVLLWLGVTGLIVMLGLII